MLFRSKIEKVCAYCQHCTNMDTEQVLCVKKGVVSAEAKCSKFRYDPCKRIPFKAKALDFSKYNDEDYSL